MLSELFQLEKIMDVCEKICYFLIINFLFILCNLPFLGFCLFLGIGQVGTYLPLFLCCLVPTAPALTAVFYAMNRLLCGTNRGAIRDFFVEYRRGWPQKITLGVTQLFIVLISVTNIGFFTKQMPLFPCVLIFGMVFAFTLILTPMLYLLASRYEMRNGELWKAAVVCTIACPVNTLGNLAALGVVLMTIELIPSYAVLVMASVYGFLVTFLNKKKLQELEQA